MFRWAIPLISWKRRDDLLAVTICCMIGALLSALPHLCMWAQFGETCWVADYDDLGCYLPVAAQAYRHHPTFLTDPIRQEGGTSLYSWLPLAPGILMAKVLCLGPTQINLVWRVWAGLSIGLAWYLLFRHYLERPLIAAACAVFLMGDIGQLSVHLLVRPLWVSAQIATGHAANLFEIDPRVHTQWRIITPALSLAALLFSTWLLARALARPSRVRIAWSGLGFGLLFYVYFYYWTTVALGLILGMAIDAGRRRIYFHTGWIGALVGAPILVASYLARQSFAAGFLQRSDKFVPIGRFDELLLPKAGLLVLAVCLVWVWCRRRDLIYLWCLGAAGLALLNHQVVTGLQIENSHWNFAWGPLLSLLSVLLVVEALARVRPFPRAATWGLTALLGLHLGTALWLRAEEATRTSESRKIVSQYHAYRAQRLCPGVAELGARAVTAGDPSFVDLAVVLEDQCPLDHYSVMLSPDASDEEWDERVALNAFLLGQNQSVFAAQQSAQGEKRTWGLWAAHRTSPEQRQQRLARRLAAFRQVEHDPAAALDKYAVRYVALPTGQPQPTYLERGWDLLQQGPTWDIWQRKRASQP